LITSGMRAGFNPSRGIAIIQTPPCTALIRMFDCFNPSRGIAIIQTWVGEDIVNAFLAFQSLTRDSNHSNLSAFYVLSKAPGFNPSRGIAIIQT